MIEPYKLTFGAIRIHGDLTFSRPVIFATSFLEGPKVGLVVIVMNGGLFVGFFNRRVVRIVTR